MRSIVRENGTLRVTTLHRIDLQPAFGRLALTVALAFVMSACTGQSASNASPDRAPSPRGQATTQPARMASESGHAPRAQSPATTTPRHRTPTADDPLRVLVVGDSLSIYLTPLLTEHAGALPVAITGNSHSATGLARPDALDWPKLLADDIARVKPDAVVVLIGGNDAQSLKTPDGWIHIADFAAWKAEYRRRVAEVLDIMTKDGASIWWIGLPVMRVSDLDRVGPIINAIVQDEANKSAVVHYIDPNPVLASPDGTYRDFATDISGAQVRIREDDGVHVTRIGEDMLVAAFVGDLLSTYQLAVTD